jgi:predicted nuclease with TOPRIM domain
MRYPLLLTLILIASGAFAQNADSVLNSVEDRINSIDSLKVPKTPLDSIQTSFYKGADSLKSEYRTKLAKLDSSKNKLQSKIDSLGSLNLPTEKYTAKLDSVNNKYSETVSSLNNKMESLKSKTVGRVKDLQLPPELQDKASALTQNVEGFKLPVKDLNIPALDVNSPIAGLDNPWGNLDGLNSSIDSPLGKIGEIDGLKDIQGSLGNVSELTGKAGEITGKAGELQNITNGNLQEQLPQALETKAAEAVGVDKLDPNQLSVDKLTGQTGEAGALLNQAQNLEAMKEQVVQQVQQQAVNHFAGKEEQLQKAMEQMSKLKQKYSSLNSLADVGKKRPNEMRNKTFRERLVPGVGLQIFKKGDNLTVDLNSYVGYRFTGRITAGPGWIQRFAYDTKLDQFDAGARIFGPRVYAEYKLGKGFSPRLEGEVVNAFVPPKFLKNIDEQGSRQWVWGAFAGIKKDFRISKKVKGTSLIMFRLINTDHKSPYPDVVNVRIGFEFPQKKRMAKSGATPKK